MRISFLILVFTLLYPENIHRGCMKEDGSRSYGVRPVLAEAYTSPSGHFLIHYDSVGSDKAPSQIDLYPENGIPDYIEEVGLIADLTRETLVDLMGFRPEIDDSDGKYDIYIVNLGSSFSAAYGWNYTDDDDGIEGTSWVEIDNDYIENSYSTHGLQAMKVTVAHEFFHAIQRAYHEKSSGTYIEGGITSVNYSYFYEFSSMWIEDVIVPEGNDYLHFLSSSEDSRRFFSNPEQKFSDTDGYSVALYGHYLSSIIEDLDDGKLNTIIREVWEKFSDELLDPIDALNAVLLEYDSSFIESWVDFCSRNFYNGQFPDMNNDIYYYEDQTSTVLNNLDDFEIDNSNLHKGYINLENSLDTLSLIEDNSPVLIDNLDDLSIEMHSIIADSTGLLTMEYSNLPLLGKYIITENNPSNSDNAQIQSVSSDTILLNINNSIHFIYGGSNPSLVDILASVSYFPTIPELLSVSMVDDGIEISWRPSLGEGSLTYNVYKDNILIAEELLGSAYLDNLIEPETEYEYSVSCLNSIGESERSNIISIVSWPDDSDIINTKIISLTNPIYRPGIGVFNLVIDYGYDIDNVEINIYNIKGELVVSRGLGSRVQGRNQEYLGQLLCSALSSGIYFISIDYDDLAIKQKFTILK